MMELVQEVWKARQVAQEWKKATLVPIYKKRDRRVCGNYQGVSLLSVPGKVVTLILLERLQVIIKPQDMEAQCGFRERHGTVDQIWAPRRVVERTVEYQGPKGQAAQAAQEMTSPEPIAAVWDQDTVMALLQQVMHRMDQFELRLAALQAGNKPA